MANEFVVRNGLLALDNSVISGSLTVTNGITGSFTGTASYAASALSSSNSLTSSFSFQAANASNAVSASFATNASTAASASFTTTASFAFQAANASSASFATSASFASNASTAASASFATTASFAFNASNAASASFATNAANATTSSHAINAVTASHAVNAVTASHAINAVTASYIQLAASASNALSASYALNASNATSASYSNFAISSSFASVAANASSASAAVFASTASLAQSLTPGTTVSASNVFVSNNLTVNGTASFGYLQTVSGSAVVIGEEYIVLNTQAPAGRFAGLLIYDSGSNSTASVVWDSERNHFVYTNASGAGYTGGGFMSGPRHTGSLGSEPYPTQYRVVRGQGGDHIYDSNITDNDTNIILGINTQITGTLGVTGTITGNLTGTASFATSASYAGAASNAASASFATSAANATTASHAVNAVTASRALNANTASYATFAATATSTTTATSASYATFANTASSADNFIVRNRITAESITASSFTDNYITWTAAQINRTGGSVELQYGGSGDTRIFGNTAYPIVFSSGTGNSSFTGNVGIGSTSPIYKLDVLEAGAVVSTTVSTGSMKGIRIGNTTSATANNAIGLWFATGPHQAGIASFRANPGSDWATALAFYTHVEALSGLNDATEKMRITGEGNVGIGTITPATKVHAVGYFTSDVGGNGVEGGYYLGNSGHGLRRPGGVSNDVYLYTTNGNVYIGTTGASSQQITLLNNGNVGIGSTAPNGVLQVIAANNYSRFFSNSSTAYTYVSLGRTSSELEFGVAAAADHFFTGAVAGDGAIKTNGSSNKLHLGYSSGAPAMTINASNNVGIGNTSPSYKLDVSGPIRVNDTIYFQGTLIDEAANETAYTWLRVQPSSGDKAGVLQVGPSGTSRAGGVIELFPSSSFSTALRHVIANSGSNATLKIGGDTSALPIQFIAANSPTVTILGNGSVGIGNTSPNTKLELSVGNGVTGGLRINYDSPATSEGMDITYLNTGATVTSFDSRYNSDSAVMQFRMKTASTPVTAVTILGNGNVGINSTAPAYKLEVIGTARISSDTIISGSKIGFENSTAGAVFGATTISNTQSTTGVTIGRYLGDYAFIDIAAQNAVGGWIDFSSGSGDDYQGRIRYNNGLQSMYFYTNASSTPLVAYTSANVGIGTVSPLAKFHVYGQTAAFDTADAMRLYVARRAANVGSIIFTTGDPIASNGWAEIGQTDANGDLYFKANPQSGSFTTRMMIQGSTGYIGIGGVTSPLASLHISGSSGVSAPSGSGLFMGVDNGYANIQMNGATNAGSFIDFSSTGTDYRGRIIYFNSSDSMQFYTNGSTKLTINSDGNVGINTTNALYALDVRGIARTANSNPGFRTDHTTDYTTLASYKGGSRIWQLDSVGSEFRLYHDASSAYMFNISGSKGWIGIGTTIPQQEVHVYSAAENADVRLMGGGQSAVYLDVYYGSDGGGLYGYGSKDITIGHNGTGNYVYFKPAGSVGIGTTAPDSILQLGGYSGNPVLTFAATNNSFSKINFYDNNNTEGLYIRTDGEAQGGTMTFGARWDDDEGKIYFKMYQSSAGASYDVRVGIGTSTPTAILHTGNAGITAQNTYFGTGQVRIGGGSDHTTNTVLSVAPGVVVFDRPGIVGGAMKIDGNGNVGINQTSPTSKLHVDGGTRTSTLAWGDTDNAPLAALSYGSNYVTVETNDVYGIRIITNGSTRMTFDTVGNIGINTTVPAYKLHIFESGSNITGGNAISNSTIKGLVLNQMINENQSIGVWFSTNGSHWSGISGQRNDYTTTWGTDLRFYTHENATNDLTYTRERMRIASEGNVGIGTTTPNVLLHLFSSSPVLRLSPSAYGLNYNTVLGAKSNAEGVLQLGNNGSNYIAAGNTGTGGALYIYTNCSSDFITSTNGTATAAFLANGNSILYGNVGIGSTAPAFRIDILGSSDQTLKLKSTGANGVIYLDGPNRMWGIFAGANSGRFTIKDETGNVDAISIVTGGSVGIGTIAPTQRLHVVGAVVGGAVATAGVPNPSGVTTQLAFEARSTGAGNEPSIAYHKEGVYTMYLQGQNSGRGLYLYSPSGETTANFYCQGDVVAYASSDKRLKDNITPITDAITKVTKLGGYEFDWSNNQDVYKGHDYGVIAQEVEEIFPELVQTRQDGYKAVKYDKLTAVLIEAIKEQQKQIDELKYLLQTQNK